jgi:glycosyltransferase involved in cell wall biosynthesis
VYRNYNKNSFYVSISDSDRSPDLQYIATVYHGINLNQFTFSPEKGDYLLFFGRIHPDKGAHEAIQIARRVGMKLILAGIIQDQNYYHAEIVPYLDDQRITYIGSVGPQQRDRLLQDAYALLHPIYFEEPFGLSVVEAMACGTPVIAFNKGSMAEIIDDRQTGFLVNNVDEAVERIPMIQNIERQRCRDWLKTSLARNVW